MPNLAFLAKSRLPNLAPLLNLAKSAILISNSKNYLLNLAKSAIIISNSKNYLPNLAFFAKSGIEIWQLCQIWQNLSVKFRIPNLEFFAKLFKFDKIAKFAKKCQIWQTCQILNSRFGKKCQIWPNLAINFFTVYRSIKFFQKRNSSMVRYFLQ